MDKKELQAKIDQTNRDIASLEANRAELEKGLVEPKLRHGDEYVDDRGEVYYALYIKNAYRTLGGENPLVAVNWDGVSCGNISSGNKKPTGRNIFDDLKRNSEDLVEFVVKNGKTTPVSCINFADGIRISQPACVSSNLDRIIFNQLEHVVEFHQKLGQWIATKKRKQNA